MTTPETPDASAGRLYLGVEADTSDFDRGLQRRIDAATKTIRGRVRVVADATRFREDVEKRLKAAMKGIEGRVKVTADTRGLATQVREAVRRIQETMEVRLKVDVDDRGLRDRVETAAKEASGRAQVKVDADTTAATARTEEFRRRAGRDVNVNIRVRRNALERIGRDITKLSMFPAIASGITLAVGAATNLATALFAVTSATSQALGLLALLPNLVVAAGQGIAGLLVGLSGVGEAYKQMGRADLASASGAGSAAKAREAAAERIRDAQTRLADAYRSAGETAERGAERVRDAQMRLADAQETGARRVVSAERDLAQAQQDSEQAQVDLNAARAEAAERLEDLRLQLAGAALDEEGAVLAVERAKQRLDRAMSDDTFSGLDKREADLSYREALQRLAEIRESNADLQRESQEAFAAGVEGAGNVVAAQNRVAESQQRQAEAAGELRRAQVEAARDIAEAQRDLGKAQREAARDNADAQRQIAEAQHDLARAMSEQTDALTGQSAAASRLNAAMANLSPAGQRFVKFLRGQVQPVLKRIRFAAQEALLPPLQDAMTRLLVLAPDVSKALAGTGKALGATAVAGAKLATSPSFRKDFATITASNNRALKDGGTVLVNLVDAARYLLVAGGPFIERFTKYLVGLSERLRDFLKRQKEAGDQDPKKGLNGFFERSWDTARRLKNILRDVLIAIKNVAGASIPAGNSVLQWLEDAAAAFRVWTEHPENQQKMKDFFDDSVPVLKEVSEFLGKVLDLFVRIGDITNGDTLNGLFQTLNTLVSAMEKIAEVPGAGPVLTALFTLSGVGLGMGLVATAIGRMARSLGNISRLTGLGKLLDLLKPGGDGKGKKGGRKTKAGDLADDVDDLTDAIDRELPHDRDKTGALDDLGTAAGTAGGKTKGAGDAAEDMGKKAEKSAKRSRGLIGTLARIAKGAGAAVVALLGVGPLIAGALAFGLNEAGKAISGDGVAPISIEGFQRTFGPVQRFFTGTLPGWAKAGWGAAKAVFSEDSPLYYKNLDATFGSVKRFFTETVPGWAKSGWSLAKKPFQDGGPLAGDGFRGTFGPVSNLFTQTIPGWASSSWSLAKKPFETGGPLSAQGFRGTFGPVSNFFTQTIPAWGRSGWSLAKKPFETGGPLSGVGFKNTFTPVFTFFTKTIPGWVESGLGAARTKAQLALGAIGEAFSQTVSFIGEVWDGIKQIARKPIEFVVNTVYNKGIRAAWNPIARLVNAPELPEAKFAEGGTVPGYAPRRDTVPALLSPGEGVLIPEAVRGLGGARAISTINGLFRSGLQRFADGGIAGTLGRIGKAVGGAAGKAKEVVSGAGNAVSGAVLGQVAAAFKAAMAPLRSLIAGTLNGSTYERGVGGVGTKAMDKLAAFLAGKDKIAGSGHFEGSPGKWPPPIMGVLSANTEAAVEYVRRTFGISRIGTLGSRPNVSDHPLGKALDAMIDNWMKPAGIALGGRVASFFTANPNMFGTKYVIWRGQINNGRGWEPYTHPLGRTDPTSRHFDHVHVSLYDDGGMLQPGITLNGTRRPEAVLTEPQWDTARSAMDTVRVLARAGASSSHVVPRQQPAGGTQRPLTVNVYPRQGQSEEEIAAIVSRRISRAGR